MTAFTPTSFPGRFSLVLRKAGKNALGTRLHLLLRTPYDFTDYDRLDRSDDEICLSDRSPRSHTVHVWCYTEIFPNRIIVATYRVRQKAF